MISRGLNQMRYILLLALSVMLFGDDLEVLLAQYNQETQLHKETKKEAAGHITLFTREDLDQMQAYTLNDVLNTIRMFNLQASRSGGTKLGFASAKSSSITPIKIFINNHELNNVTFGNPIAQYGAMNLFFIDYIEVYQAGNSISFGNESGGMVIKLYTKKPELENATYGEITVDSRASKQLNILTANTIDEDYSYLLNFDVNDRIMKKADAGSYNLSRDYTIGHMFFEFKKRDDYTIDIGATIGHKDTFAGFSMTPVKDDQEGANAYIQIDKNFDNNFMLKASANIEKTWIDYVDGEKVNLSDGSKASKLQISGQTASISLIAEKKINFSSNDLLIAAKVKQDSGKMNYCEADGFDKDMIEGPTLNNIYSIYAEDMYSIDDNNLLTFGLKYNYFTNNTSLDVDPSFIYRAGYISHYSSFTNKIFIFNRVIQPTMGQTSFSPVKIKPNANLKATRVNILSGNSLYSFTKDTSIDIGLAAVEVKDPIVAHPIKKQYVNMKDNISFERFYLTFKHSFNLYNKLTFGYYGIFKEKSFSPSSGVLVQLFNKIGKVSIYNELVYRSKYENEIGKELDAGYDYSLAISYAVTKKSIVKLKGENIFDTASEVYIYDNPTQGGIYEPARQQRALASWEYEF